MPINFPTQVYLPVFNTFARRIIVRPYASQPGEASYEARGIFDTEAMDVAAEDGSIISDARTILDIRMAEFATLPMQGDVIEIPADGGLPEEANYVIADLEGIGNAGGEITLILKRSVTEPE